MERITQIQQIKTEVIRGESCGLKDLSIKYATDFWAGAWKELLVDADGNQYGTFDQNGQIYPETLAILKENKITPENGWPLKLWQLAGESKLLINGVKLNQYWSPKKAEDELKSFLKDVETGGFSGEILLLKDLNNDIVGFTAYTVGATPEIGSNLAQKRFPYEKLIVPGLDTAIEITLENLINKSFPNMKVGLYLDFAISESQRGLGLGSSLFDQRIKNLIQLGADIIVGRTIKTSPAQYFGNYIARGMEQIAYDPTNPDKAIFAVTKEGLKERDSK